MRHLFFLFLVVLCTPAAFAQDHGSPEDEASFEAWRSACFADGYCEARTAVGGDSFAIGRHAELIDWELSYVSDAHPPGAWEDVVLQVDEETTAFSSYSETGSYHLPNAWYFLGTKAQTILDSLAPGTELVVTYNEEAGTAYSAQFSLSGLSAALLWIDEKQGRIGSERIASAPPYGLTPVYPDSEPVDIPVALLERHRRDPECRPFEDIANGRDFVADVWADDPNYKLFILPCDSYAYNFGYKVYIQSYDDIQAVYVAEYAGADGWTGSSMVFLGDYDPERNLIYSFYKYRGIGDCGSQGTWEGYQYAVRMVEFRSRDCLDDLSNLSEEEMDALYDYPVIFRAEGYVPDEEATTESPDTDRVKNR